MERKEVVILGGARTPFGRFCGSLKELSATDLAVVASRAALERCGVEPERINHVIMGNALQTSGDALYLARHVGLKAGVPLEVPAVTVNRLCGSGFQAIINAAEQIILGEAEYVLAGGAENMSQAPHVIRGARWGIPLGKGQLEDALWTCLLDTYCALPMAMTAEVLGEKYGVTREEVDAYAYRSQMAAKAFVESGKFRDEVVPAEVPNSRGTKLEVDENPRPETTLEGLSRLKPYFKKDGLITPGNASGIVDGGAAVVVTSAEAARASGRLPLGRLVSWAVVGCEPSLMGIGPAPAARAALKKAGLTLEDMDLVEVNEAFGPQYLAVEKELGLDRQRTNVNGGAIAIGHPLGATGTRITLTLLLELRRRGVRYGLGSACIGGGQGIAVIVESYKA